ncbi:MAG: tape measure protein [Lactococcus raffinolactis]|jgi:tape measure domain-containing protein|nr:tape measure protein [Lactococcus raffinolactis]
MANAKFEVEIYGNTASFENSLKGINTAMSALKSEASGLKGALKLDPTNTQLMAKLQGNFRAQLEQTKNKASQLKSEISGIDKSTPDGQKKFLQLSRDLQTAETRAGYLQQDIKNLDAQIAGGKFKLNLKTDEAENGLEKVKNGFGSLKTIAIGALLEIGSKIASTVGNKFGDWIGGAVDTQKSMIALKNTMNFSGNGSEFDGLSKRMQKLAQDTNANASDAVKLATTFIGLGNSSDVAGNKVDSLIRANQAFGGTSEDLKSVSQAYSQMSASGKVSAENINQLTDANTALGSALKTEIMKNPALKSFGSFAEASEKGAVSVDMLDTALQTLGKAGGSGTETIKDSFDSLDETISNALLPALDAITPIVTDIVNGIADSIPSVIQWFKDLWQAIENTGAIGILKSAFDSIKSAFQPVTDMIGDFISKSDGTSGAIGLIAGAFKLLADAVKIVADVIKFVSDLLTDSGTAGDIARSAVMGLIGAFVAFKVVTGIIKLASAAMAIFNAVMALNPIMLLVVAITALVAGLIYFFTQTKLGKEIWANFIEWLKGAWEGIKDFFSGLGTWFSELWTGITTTASAIWQGIVDFIGGIATAIMNFFAPFVDFFSAIFGLVGAVVELAWQLILAGARLVWSGITTIFGAVVGFFSPIWNAVSAVVSTVFSAIGQFASNAWNGIVSVFSAIGGWFSGIFSGVSSAVGNVFSGFGRFAQDAWNGITSVFGNVGKWFGDIFDGIGKTVSNVFKGITDTIEKVTGTISGITDKVKGFFGGSSVIMQREFADLKARGLTQNSSNVQNKYENSFTINAGNNQDPTAIARAVRREFELGRA